MDCRKFVKTLSAFTVLAGTTSGLALLALLWGGYQALAASPGEVGPSALSGTVYYVAPTGSDTNPGTEGQPWRTIQKAADTLVSGDTVYIKAGTYKERVVPQNSGSADNYIVYAASPGDTVIIDGADLNVPEWAGLFDITNKAYIKVAGLKITNTGPNPHNPGILVDQSNHIIVENNYISNTTDSGIGVWSSHHIIVDHNEVVGACYAGWNECISVGGTDVSEVRYNHVYRSIKEGICVKDGSSNAKVFGNHVHDTDAVCFYVDAQDKHTYNIEVFENVAHDGVENGFALASEVGGFLENIKVYNNIGYNNTWCGLHVTTCCIETHPISNVQIVNNTFYHNGRGELNWGGGILVENPQATGVVIRNNICSQNLTFQIAVSPEAGFTADHNLIDGYRGDQGEIYGDNYVEGDPRFVNAAGNDFHLLGDSPAIDRGSSVDAPAWDFDKQPRPHGVGYDIGADEYVDLTGITATATSTPTHTLTPTATRTPTITPSPKATSTLRRPGEVVSFSKAVQVFDNASSLQDLTGSTDFDAHNDRQLVIKWDVNDSEATDWHVYAQTDIYGYFYVGRTGAGNVKTLLWPGSQFVGSSQKSGPSFGHTYRFRAIGLRPDKGYSIAVQQKPVGYAMEGSAAAPIYMVPPASLPEGTLLVTDDVFDIEDLSNGTDEDGVDAKAVFLRWNVGSETYWNYHIFVSVNGGESKYLGQTGAGDINYFRWSNIALFSTASEFQEGPVSGNTYQFSVAGLLGTGFHTVSAAGPVYYSVRE